MIMPREKREIQKEDIMPLDVYTKNRRELRKNIVDFKNNGGWIHISQLKKNNSAIATKDKILFKNPTFFAKPIALIKQGRLLILEKCEQEWCEITSGEFQGWIKTDNIWGLN